MRMAMITAGLSFWPGGLTLIAAAPGIGKTSWLLRMVYEAAANGGFPSAMGCYEHTERELKHRMRRQSSAAIAGPHGDPDYRDVESHLASAGNAVLLELSGRDDSVRGIEERLLMDYSFPAQAPALLAVDYIQRIPVIGLTGLLPEEVRAGEAAAQLRTLGRKHGWAIVAATALRSETFDDHDFDLGALLGDERLPYEADRVVFLSRSKTDPLDSCACFTMRVKTGKDRTDAVQDWEMQFWGERFYPAIGPEIARYETAHV